MERGYAALIPNLFGEPFTSREHGLSVIRGLVDDPTALRARLAGSLACLQERGGIDPLRLGALGFCFGGLAALELARSGAALRVAASFHGGLSTRAPARPGAIQGSVLVCTGGAHPYIPNSARIAEQARHEQAPSSCRGSRRRAAAARAGSVCRSRPHCSIWARRVRCAAGRSITWRSGD